MNKIILSTAFLTVILCFFSFQSNAQPDWVGNMFPASGSSSTITEGDGFTIYVQVYDAGRTEPAGQGAGIICEIYYGDVDAFGMPWNNIFTHTMTYNVDIGNNDEYQGTITPTADLYEFTCRCSEDGGASWTFASLPSGNGMLTVDAPLPLELANFKATPISNAIHLEWETTNESNSSHFVVERSKDSENWETISTIEAQGYSYDRMDYSVKDDQPMIGQAYYRLKQVDFDERFTYSDIVTAEFYQEQDILVYPNPVNEVLQIQFNASLTGSFEIYSLQGQLIKSKRFEDELDLELNVATLPKGIYLYHIIDNKNHNKKIIESQKLMVY